MPWRFRHIYGEMKTASKKEYEFWDSKYKTYKGILDFIIKDLGNLEMNITLMETGKIGTDSANCGDYIHHIKRAKETKSKT